MLGALTVKSQPHFPKKTNERNQTKVKGVYWADIIRKIQLMAVFQSEKGTKQNSVTGVVKVRTSVLTVLTSQT